MNTTTAAGPKPRGTKVPAPGAISETCLPDRDLNHLAQIFKLMADESRLKILMALCSDTEIHVTALCALLSQTQPAVSHHLTLMRMAGLIGYRRDGKHNFYRLESSLVRDLLDHFAHQRANGYQTPHVGLNGFCIKPK